MRVKPTDRGEHTIRRRGATAERSNRKVAFNRRSATRDQNILLGGLKSTAYHHDRAHLGTTTGSRLCPKDQPSKCGCPESLSCPKTPGLAVPLRLVLRTLPRSVPVLLVVVLDAPRTD